MVLFFSPVLCEIFHEIKAFRVNAAYANGGSAGLLTSGLGLARTRSLIGLGMSFEGNFAWIVRII